MNATQLGWAYVISGIFLIAVGGVITTLGWNRLAVRDQHRDVLQSLVRQVELNQQMITAALELAQRWPRRVFHPEETFSYQSYHSTYVVAILTSGALDPRDAQDGSLIQALDRYQEALAGHNAGLHIVSRSNPGLFLKRDFIHIRDAKQWPATRDEFLSESFRKLVSAHEKVRGLLRARGLLV